jgi:hypothetical protein
MVMKIDPRGAPEKEKKGSQRAAQEWKSSAFIPKNETRMLS